MNAKKTLGLGVSATIVVAVVGMVLVGQRKTETPITREPAVIPAEIVSAPTPAIPPPEISVIETTTPVQTALANVAPVPKGQTVAAQVTPPAGGKQPIQDPDAREALSLVGADPIAEEYWMGAIFDPSLPEKERADLMEDLNEEGLSDPKHPSPEDLVLIQNRIPAIERALAGADPFMQIHLLEALGDLQKLLTGQEVQ